MNETGRPESAFHTTRWTMVLQARGEAPEARLALGELCENYWMPVFRFLLREGRGEDESRELAQEFFARILSGSGFEGADPEKGRFRSYLLGALKHFLAERRRNENRIKRGGNVVIESMDSGGTETSLGLSIPDPEGATPDTYFDKEWALEVVNRGLSKVQERFRGIEKEKQFEILKPWLMGDPETLSQAEAAAALGMNPGAVKVAIHRLRKGFREAVEAEIAETIENPGEIRGEMRYLIEVLS